MAPEVVSLSLSFILSPSLLPPSLSPSSQFSCEWPQENSDPQPRAVLPLSYSFAPPSCSPPSTAAACLWGFMQRACVVCRRWLKRLHGMNSLHLYRKCDSLCAGGMATGSDRLHKRPLFLLGVISTGDPGGLTWAGRDRISGTDARWLIYSLPGPRGLQRAGLLPPPHHFPVLTQADDTDSVLWSHVCKSNLTFKHFHSHQPWPPFSFSLTHTNTPENSGYCRFLMHLVNFLISSDCIGWFKTNICPVKSNNLRSWMQKMFVNFPFFSLT